MWSLVRSRASHPEMSPAGQAVSAPGPHTGARQAGCKRHITDSAVFRQKGKQRRNGGSSQAGGHP